MTYIKRNFQVLRNKYIHSEKIQIESCKLRAFRKDNMPAGCLEIISVKYSKTSNIPFI